MTVKPETMQKHIEVWRRKKAIYDRHLAGETYPAIARDLGVPIHNVVRHATDWRDLLDGYPRYLSYRDILNERYRRMADYRFLPLVDAGLLGSGKRSPEYGYA
jgi:hypothetical protein